ncbi:hypothetical protein MKK67_26610, partial [Methylobacterium sp. J-072]|uniref:hypothetical protein n=1 Tax=Methylobacterium sp. J-072 TaxID=2836651 RepID=UPI001FB89A67
DPAHEAPRQRHRSIGRTLRAVVCWVPGRIPLALHAPGKTAVQTGSTPGPGSQPDILKGLGPEPSESDIFSL